MSHICFAVRACSCACMCVWVHRPVHMWTFEGLVTERVWHQGTCMVLPTIGISHQVLLHGPPFHSPSPPKLSTQMP